MRIKFDPNQPHQTEAIEAVCGLFRGQPNSYGATETLVGFSGGLFSDIGISNQLLISENQILENLRIVQRQYGISESVNLDGLDFSIEMETGTGKTYAYLRTLFELNTRFGFRKFVIVVPNVAIREGVQKSIDMTRDHFSSLYKKLPYETWTYSSDHLSLLRQFATSNQLQLLIVNIDAFNKEANIINRENDKLSGRKPIEFIRACCPIVILDEPQNMEGEQAKSAVSSLNPLCTLRYSATHRKIYNLIYRLDPVRAYEEELVKRIEVDSVLEDDGLGGPYLSLLSVQSKGAKVVGRMTVRMSSSTGIKEKTISVSKNGDSLQELSGSDEYQDYVIDHVDAGNGYVAFTNGITLSVGETRGGYSAELMKAQIYETILEHLEKELSIKRTMTQGERLKILSLFFIDRVANYVPKSGKIRSWFEASYNQLAKSPRYSSLKLPECRLAHNGYFAEYRGGARDTSGDSAADDAAYALIMRDKERLLSLDEPLRFIFSHSALREGWDNPNVFQICTLNETRSEIKKRQEIGRGLRLPVNESGERCHDSSINRLTVVVNESYRRFALGLQKEIEDDCGVTFEGKINNKRERKALALKKDWSINPNFIELWNKINRITRFSVHIDTEELVRRASEALRQMPKLLPAKIVSTKTGVIMEGEGIKGRVLSVRHSKVENLTNELPDVLSYLQKQTNLTRETLSRVLVESNRLPDFIINPQSFIENAYLVIQSTLNDLMVAGIQYEIISGRVYEMRLFEIREMQNYLPKMIRCKNSIYDYVGFESEVEKRFVEILDGREDIKLFLKLPSWFQINTPLGSYNPDWAIVKGEENKLYLVRETKGSKEEGSLRGSEAAKIRCGFAHFNALGTDFAVVSSADEV